MQPTKYASPGRFLGVPALSKDGAGAQVRAHGAALGSAAPLDLIEEHLTDENSPSLYRRGSHGGVLLKSWFFPESWQGVSEEFPEKFVLKVQPFAKGGYEMSVRMLNLEKIGRALDFGGHRGKREVPDVISLENVAKAAARSKRKMRLLVKNMMADHLVTFTRREAEGSVYWTAEQWASAWDHFRRLMTRFLGDFPYVAILERHEKGNYHLHVAWVGRVNVGIVRKMWLLALGGARGAGNIDAKHIKVPHGGDRSSRIARYISKYVSKHFQDSPRYNKKRYWASRQSVEDARRYVLSADTLDKAINEAVAFLNMPMVLLTASRSVFVFPDGSGMWASCNPGLPGSDPPF